MPTGVAPGPNPSSSGSSNRGSRRNSKDLTTAVPAAGTAKKGTRTSKDLSEVVPPPPVEKQTTDFQAMLRQMEMDVEKEAKMATAERTVAQEAEEEEKKAQIAAKVEEAAAQMHTIDMQLLADDSSVTPDLKRVRARRKSRELTTEAMGMLGESLESTFKAIDLDGSGTLDLSEVQEAFKKGGKLHFNDETLKPILEDLLKKNGGEVNFEQFKSIAWQASIQEAGPVSPPKVDP